MAAIHMQYTTVKPEKTIMEIKMVFDRFDVPYRQFSERREDDGSLSVFFSIMHNGTELPFKLPVNAKGLLAYAKKQRVSKIKDLDQATKVAWRQVLRWVESQLALVQSHTVECAQVFLPYMVVDGNDNTMYDRMLATNFNYKQIGDGR